MIARACVQAIALERVNRLLGHGCSGIDIRIQFRIDTIRTTSSRKSWKHWPPSSFFFSRTTKLLLILSIDRDRSERTQTAHSDIRVR